MDAVRNAEPTNGEVQWGPLEQLVARTVSRCVRALRTVREEVREKGKRTAGKWKVESGKWKVEVGRVHRVLVRMWAKWICSHSGKK